MRPRLLDLFCGAGGCSVGYHRAGFDVVGVDLAPQPRYPFEFRQCDALEALERWGRDFDVIHASPPCQRFSVTRNWGHTRAARGEVADLLTPALAMLARQDRPYVVENVVGAPMPGLCVAKLCGLMFGLKMFRHRLFGSSVLLMVPWHPSHKGKQVGRDGYVCMMGHGDSGRWRVGYDQRSVASWRAASGIDWMIRDEMGQAIPPAYTEYVGLQLLACLEVPA